MPGPARPPRGEGRFSPTRVIGFDSLMQGTNFAVLPHVLVVCQAYRQICMMDWGSHARRGSCPGLHMVMAGGSETELMLSFGSIYARWRLAQAGCRSWARFRAWLLVGDRRRATQKLRCFCRVGKGPTPRDTTKSCACRTARSSLPQGARPGCLAPLYSYLTTAEI